MIDIQTVKKHEKIFMFNHGSSEPSTIKNQSPIGLDTTTSHKGNKFRFSQQDVINERNISKKQISQVSVQVTKPQTKTANKNKKLQSGINQQLNQKQAILELQNIELSKSDSSLSLLGFDYSNDINEKQESINQNNRIQISNQIKMYGGSNLNINTQASKLSFQSGGNSQQDKYKRTSIQDHKPNISMNKTASTLKAFDKSKNSIVSDSLIKPSLQNGSGQKPLQLGFSRRFQINQVNKTSLSSRLPGSLSFQINSNSQKQFYQPNSSFQIQNDHNNKNQGKKNFPQRMSIVRDVQKIKSQQSRSFDQRQLFDSFDGFSNEKQLQKFTKIDQCELHDDEFEPYQQQSINKQQQSLLSNNNLRFSSQERFSQPQQSKQIQMNNKFNENCSANSINVYQAVKNLEMEDLIKRKLKEHQIKARCVFKRLDLESDNESRSRGNSHTQKQQAIRQKSQEPHFNISQSVIGKDDQAQCEQSKYISSIKNRAIQRQSIDLSYQSHSRERNELSSTPKSIQRKQSLNTKYFTSTIQTLPGPKSYKLNQEIESQYIQENKTTRKYQEKNFVLKNQVFYGSFYQQTSQKYVKEVRPPQEYKSYDKDVKTLVWNRNPQNLYAVKARDKFYYKPTSIY
eukprot:403366770